MKEVMKEAARKAILECACNLFLERSITEVTIVDIAKSVGVGEATIYRYFERKSNIVLGAAELILERLKNEYFKQDDTLTGFKAVERFYMAYLNAFKSQRNIFTFVNDLDLYLALEPNLDTSRYDKAFDYYKNYFFDAYNKGLNDKTVRKIDDIEAFYNATTLSVLNLAKKFAAKKKLLDRDNLINGEKEIEIMINLILNELKG